MRHFWAILVILFLLIAKAPARIALAQDEITPPSASYQFGNNILFEATLQTTQPLKYALFYYHTQGSMRTNVVAADLSVKDASTYLLKYLLDINEQPQKAFSSIEYYFEVTLKSGQVLTSPTGSLDYIDNRFNWRHKQDQSFEVHWYKGDNLFAQKALDAAKSGLQRIQKILPLSATKRIDIYIYPSSSDMQETMLLSWQSWVAGHADPELGVIVVTLPEGPEQQMLTEQRIPHELMHVLLFQSLSPGASDLPTWLNEGLASNAEPFPNPDYQLLLDSAYSEDKLIPITYYCKSFPNDASGAVLAYAQSASFVSFLHDTYGMSGLKALVDEYADGVDCESGVKNALGADLSQLEREWRKERFNEDLALIAIKRMLPWLAVLAAVMIAPIGLMLGWLHHRSTRTESRRVNLDK